MKRFLYLLVLLSCGVIRFGHAQAIHFTATPSANKVGLNENFQIQYTIQNAHNVSGFTAPQFRHFQVLQQSQYMGSSIINGKVSQSISYTFVLQPSALGNFTIEAAGARVNGNSIRSNPVTIEVVKGNASANPNNNSNAQPAMPNPFSQPSAPQQQSQEENDDMAAILPKGEDPMAKIKKNLFVRVEVDKTNVYKGQQITATYKLYTRLPTSSRITKIPAFSGFSTKDIDIPNPPQPSIEHLDGKTYKVFAIRKTMLFPLQTGKLELDPVEVHNTVRLFTVVKRSRRQSNDPFDQLFNDPFFKDPFGDDDPFSGMFGGQHVSYKDYNYNFKSNPVIIHVKPLPEDGKPADFNGAVGDFTLHATIDKSKLSTDDAATLKVTVRGSGNINLLNAPTVKFPSDFESYAPKVTDKLNDNSNPMSGSRTFEYVFTPKTSGQFTLPPVTFSYFNPQTQTYQELQSKSFDLAVSKGKNSNNNSADYSLQNNELQPNRTGRLSWSKSPLMMIGGWWYWLILIVPILVIILLYLLQQRNRKISSDVVKLKHKKANKVALKRLSKAAKYLKQQDGKAFYEETSHAIWGYLSHKFNIPFADLSRQQVQQKLLKRNISEVTVNQLFVIIDNCEVALYAPGGEKKLMNETYDKAVKIISKLEDELK